MNLIDKQKLIDQLIDADLGNDYPAILEIINQQPVVWKKTEDTKSFDMDVFSVNLRNIRGKMSRKNFAETVGISHNAVRSYEEMRSMPSAYVLYNIAKAYNISIDYLLGLNDIGGENNV